MIRADSYPSSDSSVEMSDELASTLASIQEFMAGVSRRLDQIESSRQDPQWSRHFMDPAFPAQCVSHSNGELDFYFEN